jgi:hypothetical protein
MHTRYRWLSVVPLGRAQLAKVASAMQAKPYSRQAKSGYSLSTVRGDWLEGAYTERVEYVERVTDPLGGELSISRVEFRRTEFRLSVVYPQLEMRDPARQVRPLINLIGDSLDFHVAVTPISVSPLLWVKALTTQGEAVQILTIRSTKFSLSNDARASVLVTGTSDVRASLPTLLGTRPVEADYIVCGWGSESRQWRVELRATGCASVLMSPVDNPGQVLRKALPAVNP